MIHFHLCPNCYEHVPCEMKCTIEYDLQDGDREFGAFCICDECDITKQNLLYSKEWWSKYTGVKLK